MFFTISGKSILKKFFSTEFKNFYETSFFTIGIYLLPVQNSLLSVIYIFNCFAQIFPNSFPSKSTILFFYNTFLTPKTSVFSSPSIFYQFLIAGNVATKFLAPSACVTNDWEKLSYTSYFVSTFRDFTVWYKLYCFVLLVYSSCFG